MFAFFVYVCVCGGGVVLLQSLFSDLLLSHYGGGLNYLNHGLVDDIPRWLDQYESLKALITSALYISRSTLRMLNKSDGRPSDNNNSNAQIFVV